MAIQESPVDFSVTLDDEKYRTEPEAKLDGANLFRKKFCGKLWWLGGTPIRDRDWTLDLLVDSKLARDKRSAEDVLSGLVGIDVPYIACDSIGYRFHYFELQKVENNENEPHYRLNFTADLDMAL